MRSRCQENIKYARNLLGDIPVGEGAREAGETSVHNARRGEKEGSEERKEVRKDKRNG